MLVLGHVASATLACHGLDRRADLRWVVFFTLLADIVDKPLGLVVFHETINNGRVWFHSVTVNLALTLVLLLWQKPLVYPLALWLHQLCDRMWTQPWVAFWPFSGGFERSDLPLEEWIYGIFNPYNVVSEVLGLALLIGFAVRHRLYRWERLRRLVVTGTSQ